MNLQILGKTIQTYRKNKSLSQEILSGLAGIDRSHLSKIELGQRSPTVTVLYKLAAAMNLSGSQLLLVAEQAEQGSRQGTEALSPLSLPSDKK